jgi:hypothetical protein
LQGNKQNGCTNNAVSLYSSIHTESGKKVACQRQTRLTSFSPDEPYRFLTRPPCQ